MSKPAKRDEEILARIRERFPGEEESRRQLADAVAAAASMLGEVFGAFCIKAGLTREQVAATSSRLAKAALVRDYLAGLADPDRAGQAGRGRAGGAGSRRPGR